MAKLHSPRLVKAAESQKQAALDEAAVKEATGGDTISARYLYQEYFDFKPQFKIWLTTNHLPEIRGTDDAIWRRIHLIPFKQKFTGKSRDSKLRQKLESELNTGVGGARLPGMAAFGIGYGIRSKGRHIGLSP